jgi:NitT/TauT family transport system ATP-binding protein
MEKVNMTGRSKISIRNLGKTFGAVQALEDVSIDIKEGEFVSIVGPSGCGKSTLLNILAGLLEPSEGEVVIDGEKPQGINEKVGYITQRDNLLPWRTVIGNVEVALELNVRKQPKEVRRRMAQEWIDRTFLTGFENHYPSQLSGGMRKRVCLIRTLIYSPEIVLVDEPFASLDAQTKLALHEMYTSVWEQVKNTCLFITHDLEEAVAMSDRVIVLTKRPGRVKSSYCVPFSRPRKVVEVRFDASFGALTQKIWGELER